MSPYGVETVSLEPSPSMRREWIEIQMAMCGSKSELLSPSMRREWIEILLEPFRTSPLPESPSMRREWIEMFPRFFLLVITICLPPCGGSGLKYIHANLSSVFSTSPSMRREWIEIPHADRQM